ncbi:MAG: pantetheine-phosphate adenylyltransferase [Bacteroidales bacterium]|nr:pantetheine-phosphate adenylyltransferase [Bacteroidales bacterium]
MERIAVFPGSFDPFTIGHKVILDSALPLFDKIYIAIGCNSNKKSFFTLEKRIADISALYKGNEKIVIETYDTLTIDFCKKVGTNFILRGLRNVADFEYEQTIAQTNKQLSGIETVFIVTPPELSNVSSSIVRELLSYGADVSRYLP